MSKTWWGHYIIVDKGEEYIRFKDYLELSNRIDKAIEYIKNNTMYFDSEYAKDYGELCPIAGAGDTRIHCVIGDEQLLEILKGGNNE